MASGRSESEIGCRPEGRLLARHSTQRRIRGGGGRHTAREDHGGRVQCSKQSPDETSTQCTKQGGWGSNYCCATLLQLRLELHPGALLPNAARNHHGTPAKTAAPTLTTPPPKILTHAIRAPNYPECRLHTSTGGKPGGTRWHTTFENTAQHHPAPGEGEHGVAT
jgi:hypothetical protein